MNARGLHIKVRIFRQIKAAGVVLLGCFICPLAVTAQEIPLSESSLSFFEKQAIADANYEQHIHWQSEEDELDYWTDQRNYEKTLQEYQTHGYQAYLFSKMQAYRTHQAACDAECSHGDYYQLQAAFYIQYGDPGSSSDDYIATSTVQ